MARVHEWIPIKQVQIGEIVDIWIGFPKMVKTPYRDFFPEPFRITNVAWTHQMVAMIRNQHGEPTHFMKVRPPKKKGVTKVCSM